MNVVKIFLIFVDKEQWNNKVYQSFHGLLVVFFHFFMFVSHQKHTQWDKNTFSKKVCNYNVFLTWIMVLFHVFSLITIARIDFSSRKKRHISLFSIRKFFKYLFKCHFSFDVDSNQSFFFDSEFTVVFFVGGTTRRRFANHTKVHFFLIINHNDVDKAHKSYFFVFIE